MLKLTNYLLFLAMFVGFLTLQTNALVPFTRSIWPDLDDPFRILEHSSIPLPNTNIDTSSFALARADWKETQNAHIITIDIPGMKKDDIKIEVEENHVLRVSGEREAEKEIEGDKWHRVERRSGKFWRQFRMPLNADLEKIKAHLEEGVLKITVPKVAEEMRKHSRVIDISVDKYSGEDVKATKAEM